MLTPHMAYLAEAIARDGCKVSYICNKPMSNERSHMGWIAPSLQSVDVYVASNQREVNAIVEAAPTDSIHISEGLRGNGLVGIAQQKLIAKGFKLWIIMETIHDDGINGFLKRILYVDFESACPVSVASWQLVSIRQNGLCGKSRFSAYFSFCLLLGAPQYRFRVRKDSGPFQFLFVGQLIMRKRLDLLLRALAIQSIDFTLTVIGDGPMRPAWESLAASLLPNRVQWVGKFPMSEVAKKMADADCLVLPSLHDGWGAVVSEALIAGTPVICSDACGSAGVVKASDVGYVFRSGDLRSFRLLSQMLSTGPLDDVRRQQLAAWAHALGVSAGAVYLRSILDSNGSQPSRPSPPWLSLQ